MFEFTGTIMGAAICGWALDRWLETGPWGFLSLMLVGVAGGFIRLLQLVRRFDRIDSGDH